MEGSGHSIFEHSDKVIFVYSCLHSVFLSFFFSVILGIQIGLLMFCRNESMICVFTVSFYVCNPCLFLFLAVVIIDSNDFKLQKFLLSDLNPKVLYLYATCYILYSGIFLYIYVCCVKGISCLVICNANHALPTVFLQGSQRASSQKVIGVLGHVSLLECVPPLILHLSHTDTQIFSFSASCLPETGRI